jgi:Brp/Blh family beta-carotene 15,15'-monooxygenase
MIVSWNELGLLSAAVFLLGMPHGALDGREARDLLRPRLGPHWVAPFLLGYLGLAAATLLLWLTVPLAALTLFLLLATVHFGSHDSESGHPLPLLVRGALPIVVASAAHPAETSAIFGLLGGDANGTLLQSWLAGPLFVPWLMGGAATLLLEPRTKDRAELVGLALLFALTPPLVAFALYFGLLHSPRALRAARRPGESWPDMLRAALPWSAAASLLAIPLWLLTTQAIGEGPALIRTIFWWLSALTVPHMLLHLVLQSVAGSHRTDSARLPANTASRARPTGGASTVLLTPFKSTAPTSRPASTKR